MVFISASVVAVIFARIECNTSVLFAPDVPVIGLSESDLAQDKGESRWDAMRHRLEFGFLSIPFNEWTGDRILALVQRAFPTAVLLNPHRIKVSAMSHGLPPNGGLKSITLGI